jgi:hypothetical protein
MAQVRASPYCTPAVRGERTAHVLHISSPGAVLVHVLLYSKDPSGLADTTELR